MDEWKFLGWGQNSVMVQHFKWRATFGSGAKFWVRGNILGLGKNFGSEADFLSRGQFRRNVSGWLGSVNTSTDWYYSILWGLILSCSISTGIAPLTYFAWFIIPLTQSGFIVNFPLRWPVTWHGSSIATVAKHVMSTIILKYWIYTELAQKASFRRCRSDALFRR